MTTQIIKIKTMIDGKISETSVEAIKQSVFFREMLEDDCCGIIEENSTIDVPKLTHNSLNAIISFCEQHVKEPLGVINKPLHSNKLSENGVSEWYCNFLDSITKNELQKILTDCNFIDLQPLLELCASKIACDIRGKTPEEIKNYFTVTN